jgi:hypothetical protein
VTNELIYKNLGISEERFQTVIKPEMNKMVKSAKSITEGIFLIEGNKKLEPMEKYYCCFELSKVTIMAELRGRVPPSLRGLFTI